MKKTFLIITSISDQNNLVLKKFAKGSSAHKISFIVIGDQKSPNRFLLNGCDFYSIAKQKELNFSLVECLPLGHYARKNLGYLLAMSKGAEVIIETDDDNLPLPEFWKERIKKISAYSINNADWVNVYKYFTNINIWPRGFSLEKIHDTLPKLENKVLLECPIQQGLADNNPDVDAIYRLTLPLPVKFKKSGSVALGQNSFCPFNSQNTSWFKESFQLLYLPSYCSFRMTDIFRSFVAQRIAWTCGWSILFHKSTVFQERNEHNLINDFKKELVGYCNNDQIYLKLKKLNLKTGSENIGVNMKTCYKELIKLGVIDKLELNILNAWLKDIKSLQKNYNYPKQRLCLK